MTEKNAVSALMEKKLQAAMSAGRVRGFKPIKVPVSVRLDPATVTNLDVLAEALGESRTALATDLLNAAIQEASKQFNMPSSHSKEWFEQYGAKYREVMGKDAEGLTEEELELLAQGSARFLSGAELGA